MPIGCPPFEPGTKNLEPRKKRGLLSTLLFFLFLPLATFAIGESALGGSYYLLTTTPAYAAEKLSFIHSDHLGSTSMVTDEQGNIISQQVYYPYGSTRKQFPISNFPASPAGGQFPITEKKYTSQISDQEQTGLYYYNARYYNPQIAKFTQADTVQGLNRYAYVSNNPVILNDPSGHEGKVLPMEDQAIGFQKSECPYSNPNQCTIYYDELYSGHNFGWGESTPEQKRWSSEFFGIKVEGDERFLERTQKALEILYKLPEFSQIQPYIGLIRQAKHSGMRAYDEIPTYEVADPTSGYSTIWYASTIGHDAFHSFMYHQEEEHLKGKKPAPDSWTGTEAEKKCLKFQLKIMEQLTDDPLLLEYLKDLMENPTYQFIKYKNRNW